jgi:hypothetical protein
MNKQENLLILLANTIVSAFIVCVFVFSCIIIYYNIYDKYEIAHEKIIKHTSYPYDCHPSFVEYINFTNSYFCCHGGSCEEIAKKSEYEKELLVFYEQ